MLDMAGLTGNAETLLGSHSSVQHNVHQLVVKSVLLDQDLINAKSPSKEITIIDVDLGEIVVASDHAVQKIQENSESHVVAEICPDVSGGQSIEVEEVQVDSHVLQSTDQHGDIHKVNGTGSEMSQCPECTSSKSIDSSDSAHSINGEILALDVDSISYSENKTHKSVHHSTLSHNLSIHVPVDDDQKDMTSCSVQVVADSHNVLVLVDVACQAIVPYEALLVVSSGTHVASDLIAFIDDIVLSQIESSSSSISDLVPLIEGLVDITCSSLPGQVVVAQHLLSLTTSVACSDLSDGVVSDDACVQASVDSKSDESQDVSVVHGVLTEYSPDSLVTGKSLVWKTVVVSLNRLLSEMNKGARIWLTQMFPPHVPPLVAIRDDWFSCLWCL